MVASNPIIDPVRNATRAALDSFSPLVGLNRIPTSTVRRAMQNMTESDLDMLSREYGVDQVIHLIGKAYGGSNGNSSRPA